MSWGHEWTHDEMRSDNSNANLKGAGRKKDDDAPPPGYPKAPPGKRGAEAWGADSQLSPSPSPSRFSRPQSFDPVDSTAADARERSMQALPANVFGDLTAQVLAEDDEWVLLWRALYHPPIPFNALTSKLGLSGTAEQPTVRV